MAAKFGLLIDAKTKGENNIKRLGNSMQGVEGKAKNLGMAVRGVGAAFKGLLAVAAVGGIAALGKSLLDSADAFGKLSVRTGIAAGTLMAYVNAGKLADVSQSEIETGLRKLAQTQVEAAEGVKTYADAYGKLGISVKKADGSLKPSDKLLGEIADKFAQLPDGPEKAAVAMDIFGRSGAKLITLLNGGSESLEKFSVNVSENFAKNAELFNDQIAEIGIKFAEVGAVLLDAMLPALNAVALGFKIFLENVTNNLPVILEAFGFMTKAAILFGSAMVGVAAGKAFTALITNLNTVVKITRTLFNLEKARLVIQQGIIALQAASASIGKGGKIGAVLGVGAGAAAIAGSQQLIGELFKSIEERFAGLGAGGAGTGLGAVTLPGLQFDQIVTGGTTGTGGTSTAAGAIGRGLGRTGQVMEMLAALREEERLLNATLEGKREEVELDIKIENLTKGLTPELAAHVEEIVRGNAGIQDRINQQEELNNKTDKYKITLDQVKDTLANQMTNAIEGLIDGTKTLGQSLSGLLRTFASMFLRSGMGSLVNQIFPSAKGNVFAQNGIVPYAKGGYIGRPTMALMGEAGPEAVLPLRRGRGGRLGVETSGGGVGSVTVNVDATGSAVEGDDAQASQLGKVIGIAVQQELVKQKRPGGLLAS